LALVFPELVLVARRPEKLLELKEDLLQKHPHLKVKISTDPNMELSSTDLIITATSNDSGKILDMMQVKPGAVICDCSRPLDIGPEDAAKRPDVMVIESGEIDLPGNLKFTCDINLPYPSVYACLAETVLLALDGRYESFSLGKDLSLDKVKDIYKIGVKHGAELSAIRGPNGTVTDDDVALCRMLAVERLKTWRATKTDWATEAQKTKRMMKQK
jgi:predicted amino acid dehydrogenase